MKRWAWPNLAYKSGPPALSPKTAQNQKGQLRPSLFEKAKIIASPLPVDAACSGNPYGYGKYRCVETISKKKYSTKVLSPDGAH
ncbi:MAG: hypothetical protein IPN72_08780 [Saprospiraceae bacterium]|nr:hypothetical protein [Saprospiraceae bacterium]